MPYACLPLKILELPPTETNIRSGQHDPPAAPIPESPLHTRLMSENSPNQTDSQISKTPFTVRSKFFREICIFAPKTESCRFR